jgi:hypothetical protein
MKKVITPATIRVPRTQTALQQLESLHKVHLIFGSNFLVSMNKICLRCYVLLAFQIQDSNLELFCILNLQSVRL